jgi:hypothetical protein
VHKSGGKAEEAGNETVPWEITLSLEIPLKDIRN